MLVLTRKVQEQIKVGDNITITIIRVKGQSVRVGIEAPRDVRVMRSELSQGNRLNEESDASLPSEEDESLAPNPEKSSGMVLPLTDRMTGLVDAAHSGEVVGPRRIPASKSGPLANRVTRQAVAEMLEMASH